MAASTWSIAVFFPESGGLGTPLTGILLSAGGVTPPLLKVTNGSVTAGFTVAPYVVNAGQLYCTNVAGVDILGSQPLTQPAVPATTVYTTTTFPFPVSVYIIGGTVTQVQMKLAGQVYALGGATTSVKLPAYGTLAVTYSVAPTWVWTY